MGFYTTGEQRVGFRLFLEHQKKGPDLAFGMLGRVIIHRDVANPHQHGRVTDREKMELGRKEDGTLINYHFCHFSMLQAVIESHSIIILYHSKALMKGGPNDFTVVVDHLYKSSWTYLRNTLLINPIGGNVVRRLAALSRILKRTEGQEPSHSHKTKNN